MIDIRVRNLIEWLSQFPDDANVEAWDRGIIVDVHTEEGLERGAGVIDYTTGCNPPFPIPESEAAD